MNIQTIKMPPRTAESDAAAQTVAAAMQQAKIGGGRQPAVTVTTHADGTVTYTASGDPVLTSKVYSKLEGKLPEGYSVGKAGVNTDHFRGFKVNGKKVCGTNCAEPKALILPENKSPITGMSVIFRGNGKNPHPFSSTDKTFMCPCVSCRINAGTMQGLTPSRVAIPPPNQIDVDGSEIHLTASCCGELAVALGGGDW